MRVRSNSQYLSNPFSGYVKVEIRAPALAPWQRGPNTLRPSPSHQSSLIRTATSRHHWPCLVLRGAYTPGSWHGLEDFGVFDLHLGVYFDGGGTQPIRRLAIFLLRGGLEGRSPHFNIPVAWSSPFLRRELDPFSSWTSTDPGPTWATRKGAEFLE